MPPNTGTAGPLDVFVRQLRWEADGVVSLDLAATTGKPLPSWEPGAHLDLVLPNGVERQYSLCGPPGERSYYRIGVRRERASRGGSEYVHAFLRPGQRIAIKGPRNNFAFRPAASYVFVAGGIGITPILPMVRAAQAQGADWQLHFGGRTSASMPFLGELRGYGERVHCRPSDTVGRISLAALEKPVAAGAKVYACGPASLLSDLDTAAENWPAETLRLERFKAPSAPPAENKPIEVECAASKKTVSVAADESIVNALEKAGIRTVTSCRSGLCGSCETKVLGGIPDHRDGILSSSEQEAGDRMFVCVSRARTSRLVLDL
ncbi:oxidoreductase [Amycolatopsis sp. AA4]|uniref:PDR/VanB family oxidoreductase n=1 Tax=Actinomycetes TaxID=1760 RepID=UPI0001B570B3|nr:MULTISPECIES: PDR/VanB family oxidoreductase [Actinomycetes]ATY13754.1 oxidoreductase [Amycolatopsis sp. AA4]EFL09739.1 oxidoreductase [Streptomyces sp. AA4]